VKLRCGESSDFVDYKIDAGCEYGGDGSIGHILFGGTR
jgi:hypothetical protein